ncbi:MAG: amino acid permease [Bacteroidota bacterium]
MKALQRKLGTLDAAALIFAKVVGVGIFTTLGIIAAAVPTTFYYLLTWVIGGVFALIGGMAYTQLAATYPKAGGEYTYIKRSLGSLLGFLSGWASFVAGFSGAIAASAIGFASYLQNFGGLLDQVSGTLIAVALISISSFIHIISVKLGSSLHHVLNGLLVIALLVLVVAGLLSGPVDAVPKSTTPVFSFSSFLLILIPVFFTYSGWNAAVYVVEEIQDPKKNMVRATVLGVGAVFLIYFLINIMFVKVLGTAQIAGLVDPAYDLANKLLGLNGALAINLIILLALISSVSAMIMTGPRIYFAMARDGLLPNPIQQIHRKFNTPHIAIILQSIWSIVLVVTGTFEEILIYTGFSIVLFSGLAVSTLFFNKNVTFNSAQKLLFGLFVFVSFALVLNGLIEAPWPALYGSGIILLGIPFFYYFKRR